MLIRPAQPADIVTMFALERQSGTAAHWSEQEYGALFAPEAPRRMAVVATETAELLGFAIVRCGSEEWEIENVVVAAPHRRRGVGGELVRQILRAARQAGAVSILLEVRESNLPARKLYEQLGFAKIGRRTAYYHDPLEDALVLRSSADNL